MLMLFPYQDIGCLTLVKALHTIFIKLMGENCALLHSLCTASHNMDIFRGSIISHEIIAINVKKPKTQYETG